jgi:metal-sulfur cluster biosynthetic enzyme
VTPTASRIVQAITEQLGRRNIEDCAGGTVSIVVKLDASGCPKRIAIRTEVESDVERRKPCTMAS